jgi:hypothetical protein
LLDAAFRNAGPNRGAVNLAVSTSDIVGLSVAAVTQRVIQLSGLAEVIWHRLSNNSVDKLLRRAPE